MSERTAHPHTMSDEDEFHDAQADVQGSDTQVPNDVELELESEEVDVTRGIAAIETALDMMNKNMYTEAIEMIKPRAGACMYHAMAYGSLQFLKAAFSMDSESIQNATTELNKTVVLCNMHRKNRGVIESLSSWVFGQRMENYSTVELHAEIYYAEANLLLSFLTFIQDESLMSFIKGGLRIKSCYSLYKQLYEWLVTCENESLEVDANFASGVRMGLGCFNLFLSILPSRILRVLEFVGFSGDRDLGLEELEKGATSGTFRAPICTSFLLFFHTGLSVMLGIGDLDPDHAELLLNPHLHKYPTSVQFLYFQGRVALLRGDIDKAIVCFNQSIQAQSQWKQVHHLCWWELMWCYCAKADWQTAGSYADMLYKQSKWSKATFLYIKACNGIMNGCSTHTGVSSSSSSKETVTDREELNKMMGEIPSLKQRIAGKSLPIEKFAVAKSERFINGGRLPLCVLELLYTHNFYVILAQNQALLKNLMKIVWTELMALEETRVDNPWFMDDWCVVTLLQGVIFKALQRYDEAERCLKAVIECGTEVEHDMYCVAAASAELGLLYVETGNLEEAQKTLESTKANYKGYHLESRIHFRVHGGQYRVAQLKKAT